MLIRQIKARPQETLIQPKQHNATPHQLPRATNSAASPLQALVWLRAEPAGTQYRVKSYSISIFTVTGRPSFMAGSNTIL
jgi:hypothetical protein